MRHAFAFIAALLVPLSAFAQDETPHSSESFATPKPRLAHETAFAPYSAEQVTQIITQRNGSRIIDEPPGTKIYRDSQGRTRRESLRRPPEFTVIVDPVAHVRYMLDVSTKIAHRQKLRLSPIESDQESGTRDYPSRSDNGYRPPAPPQITKENLGTQTIEGLLVEGTKITTLWPNGQYGRGTPDSDVSEVWRSAQLQAVILRKFSSTRSVERVEKLVSISLKEPSPALFLPPPDYKVVDDAADSTLQTGNNGASTGSGRGFATGGYYRPPPGQAPDANPDVDGAYRIGGDVSAPILLSKTEPQYSEEARAAKFNGTVLLSIIVDVKGIPRDIKVIRPLGMGLDEKAIEAVSQWRFRAAVRDGQAVPVRIQVEMSFRLL